MKTLITRTFILASLCVTTIMLQSSQHSDTRTFLKKGNDHLPLPVVDCNCPSGFTINNTICVKGTKQTANIVASKARFSVDYDSTSYDMSAISICGKVGDSLTRPKISAAFINDKNNVIKVNAQVQIPSLSSVDVIPFTIANDKNQYVILAYSGDGAVSQQDIEFTVSSSSSKVVVVLN